MTAMKTTVTLEGPFFKGDPSKTVRKNIRDMLDALSEWMDETVTSEIESHAGSMRYYTGWTAQHIDGYTTSPKTGKRWQLHAAVAALTQGMSRKDAIRTKAAAASIERRWHPFRRVKTAVYRARPWITADFLKGLE